MKGKNSILEQKEKRKMYYYYCSIWQYGQEITFIINKSLHEMAKP